MKTPHYLRLLVGLMLLTWAGAVSLSGQTNAPPQTPPPQTNPPPTADSAPPPSAPPQKSQADLEKLVAPIALYPDPLIATVLPASAYPLEIVQAARFVKDTNNIAKLDAQPWDKNVKAVAAFPDVIAQMDANISWTSDLGDAFINQPKELIDAIQTMRSKAQESGALKTTSEQVVGMTNQIATNVVESQTVVVTNQVIQIQPAQPEVIYVPQYNPTVVYSGYPVSYPGYYYPPPSAYPTGGNLLSFGVGMATGAILANNIDWDDGGCWGGGDVDIDIDQNINRDVNRNVNRNVNNNVNANRGQKWQPDQNRLQNSGSQLSSAQNRGARGYPSTTSRSVSEAQRTASAAASSRPSPANRPESAGASRPEGSRPSPSASRPEASRPSSSSASRPSPSASSRPSSSQQSAFSGSGGGGATRQASARGAGSRGGGGGGGRGGGGRR